MEVKQGYKQTEVGVIPDKWNVDKLGNCLKNKPDYGIGAAAVNYNDNLWTYLRITDISDDGKFLRTNLASVDNPNSENYILNENEIVVARTGASVGKTYLYKKDDGKLIFAGFLIRLRPELSKISSQFLFAITQSKHYKDWILSNSMRSGQPGINSNQLFGLLIPLPPLPEQTAIANALSDMDALISQTEKLIEKKKAIKQGAMQELLKPKEGWVTKKLGDVCEVFGRIGFRGYTVEDIVPEHQGAISLSPSNIIDGKLSLHKATYISWDKYYESPEIMVNEGDIILVKTASIGKNCVITKLDSKATVNPQIVVLKNFKMDNLLLGYIISSPIVQNQIKTKMVGGVLATLSQEEIKNFKIDVPERHEDQQRISNLLFDLDETINLMEKKLSKLKQQKQGMMQALLTGKIRLVS